MYIVASDATILKHVATIFKVSIEFHLPYMRCGNTCYCSSLYSFSYCTFFQL